MLSLHRWQAGSALFMTLSLTSSAIAPFFAVIPASANAPSQIAQVLPDQWREPQQVVIAAGAKLPTRYDGAEKIIVLPTETVDITLTIPNNIRSRSGRLLIASGSTVKGKLKPAEAGSQFVSETLILTDGTQLDLDARSPVITRTQEIRKGTNTSSILKGAAIGGAAAAAISAIFGGRVSLGKIIGGAAIGAVGGLLLGKKKVDVVVIKPDEDLTLTLDAPLTIKAK